MPRNRDPLALSPHWHLDLRLEAELPEDNVVRARFLVGACFGTVALASLLLLAWIGYTRSSLRQEIAEWDRINEASKENLREVEAAQKEFEAAAVKIERAAKFVRRNFLYSEFITQVAALRPADTVVLDQFQTAEDGIKLGGQVASATEVGAFVAVLKQDPQLSRLFSDIKPSGFTRANTGASFSFEITFFLKPAP